MSPLDTDERFCNERGRRAGEGSEDGRVVMTFCRKSALCTHSINLEGNDIKGVAIVCVWSQRKLCECRLRTHARFNFNVHVGLVIHVGAEETWRTESERERRSQGHLSRLHGRREREGRERERRRRRGRPPQSKFPVIRPASNDTAGMGISKSCKS
jgi:hypothetical protein